jgi:hypothetical protein
MVGDFVPNSIPDRKDLAKPALPANIHDKQGGLADVDAAHGQFLVMNPVADYFTGRGAWGGCFSASC